eukprot:26511-Pyramimonas_sp.AAC.1
MDDLQFAAVRPTQQRPRTEAQHAAQRDDLLVVSKEAEQEHDVLKFKVQKATNSREEGRQQLA